MDSDSLKQLKGMSYDEVDKNALPDLSSVVIDTAIPIQERMQKYCDSVKNPYFLKVENTVVEVRYSEGKNSIENRVKDYLKSAKNQ